MPRLFTKKKPQPSSNNEVISTIIPGKLYLGSQEAGRLISELNDLGINGIINVTPNVSCYYPEEFNYLQIKIDDGSQGISDYFDQANQFIENNQPVLVHCSKGVSRSATIVIAYLMNQNNWNMQTSLDFVKSKRPIIHPHFYFECELMSYEESLQLQAASLT